MENKKYYARLSYGYEGPDVIKIGVFFPDLPGCVSCADTREEAVEMARDALGIWLEAGENCPHIVNPPSSLEELRSDGAVYEGEASHEFALIEAAADKRPGKQDGEEWHTLMSGPNGEIVIIPVRGNRSLSAGVLDAIKKQAGYG